MVRSAGSQTLEEDLHRGALDIIRSDEWGRRCWPSSSHGPFLFLPLLSVFSESRTKGILRSSSAHSSWKLVRRRDIREISHLAYKTSAIWPMCRPSQAYILSLKINSGRTGLWKNRQLPRPTRSAAPSARSTSLSSVGVPRCAAPRAQAFSARISSRRSIGLLNCPMLSVGTPASADTRRCDVCRMRCTGARPAGRKCFPSRKYLAKRYHRRARRRGHDGGGACQVCPDVKGV